MTYLHYFKVLLEKALELWDKYMPIFVSEVETINFLNFSLDGHVVLG